MIIDEFHGKLWYDVKDAKIETVVRQVRKRWKYRTGKKY